jgi:hypothetical protein
MLKIEYFNNGTTKRWDLGKLYGVGYHTSVYVGNVPRRGRTFFLNSYKKAPVNMRFLNRLGIIDDTKGVGLLFFTGSYKDPNHSWHLRLGRRFVGGQTPKWFLKFCEHITYRICVMRAKHGDDRFWLCSKCNNGLVTMQDGHPGEHLEVCHSCGHVSGGYTNLWEVE